jgi:hypothetical protein
MPQRRSDIGGGIGIGSTFAAEPIFSIRRASIIRGARRIVAVEPVEDPGRRQRVLGPAAWPLQGQPEEPGAPRRVDVVNVIALWRMVERRLLDLLVNGSQQKRSPSDGATGPLRERINLHRREKAVGRGEIKVEVDRQHDGVTPAARESTGVPALAVR